MKKNSWLLILVFTIASIAQRVSAQETPAQETKKESGLKNTIHMNVTNPLIYGSKSIIFGYERVLNNRRSFTFNIGSTTFPSLGIIDADSIELNTIRDD